jgi:hypothetical protein
MGIFIFLLLVGLSEFLLRTPFGELLFPPYVTSIQPILDVKLHRLDVLARREGQLDCIIVGSSVVWNAIDPEIVRQIYEEQTGSPLTCYNFGIPVFDHADTSVAAEAIVARYHPGLLIYGISPNELIPRTRNYAEPSLATPSDFEATLRRGWIRNNSYLYRLSHANNFSQTADVRSSPYGFTVRPGVGDVDRIPSQELDARTFDPAAGYTGFDQHARQDLSRIMALQQQEDVTVIVVEIPVAPSYQYYLPNEQEGYQEFLDTLRRYTESEGVVFLSSASFMDDPPDDIWSDHIHLNETGHVAFSMWFASELATLDNQNILSIP